MRFPPANCGGSAIGSSVDIHLPAGWSYTLAYIDTRGYANVALKATATITTTYKIKKSHGGWGGSIPNSSTVMKGQFEGDFFQRGIVPLLQWSACGEGASILHIDTTIKVSGPPSTVAVDSIDGSLDQTFGLAWYQCPPVRSLSVLQSTVSVPEPGSLAMLAGIALTALLYWWRKPA